MNEIKPSKEEFLKLSRNYNVIPVYVELLCDLETPISLFYKLCDDSDYAFLLESVEGAEKWARYSFIGFSPFMVFKSKNKLVQILKKVNRNFSEESYKSEDAFLELKNLIKGFKAPVIKGLPRFFGGAVGFVSYECIKFFERIPVAEDILNFSDLHFVFPEILLVYDRFDHSLKVIYNAFLRGSTSPEEAYLLAKEEILKVKQKLKNKSAGEVYYKDNLLKKNLRIIPEMEKKDFTSIVKKAKKYIQQGDVIQVVLSQRFYLEEELPSFFIYRALRKINPSPYLFYLKLKDEVLIGSSPEILVRMEDGVVETRPIAGTRKRGRTEKEDKALEEELKQDEKERAEHIMLVDLGRNDVGRVCKYGSVEVYELMVVERYSHVMHLVSGVRGEIKEGLDMFDVFGATFPAGTVSGAPKIRAMEIITELEKTVRGPYAGAVGYFGFSGNMDFCITIRTLFQKANKLYIQAGAGIVADSDPEKEYEETINKAKAIFKALEFLKEFC